MKVYCHEFYYEIIKIKKIHDKNVIRLSLNHKRQINKYCYFLSYRKKSTAEDLAYIFTKVIKNQHELPKEIISDRDKLFTSKF